MPALLALLHAVTIGYVALLFADTLQQLLPVLLVTRLALAWPGGVALPLLAFAAADVVMGFTLGFQPLALAAGLVTATVYLALAVTLGFLLAAALHAPPLARALGYRCSSTSRSVSSAFSCSRSPRRVGSCWRRSPSARGRPPTECGPSPTWCTRPSQRNGCTRSPDCLRTAWRSPC